MPSADQVKALIASMTEGDDAHFFSIAMQIAAHEARMGHGKLAEEIRDLIDRATILVIATGASGAQSNIEPVSSLRLHKVGIF